MAEDSSTLPRDSDQEDSSIEEFLEREARRSRQRPSSVRGDLPEGYVAAEELLRTEGDSLPWWVRGALRWAALGVLAVVFYWMVAVPLTEALLSRDISQAVTAGRYRDAAATVRWARLLGGTLVRDLDSLVADYLKQLLERGKVRRFHSEYGRLRRNSPGPRTHQVYTAFLLRVDRHREAARAAERLLQYPSPVIKGIGHLYRGRALVELNRWDEAVAPIREARRFRGEDPNVYRLQRDLHAGNGRWKRALRSAVRLRHALEEAERQAVSADFLRLAKIYQQLGKPRARVRALQDALERNPVNRGALEQLIRVYMAEERWPFARDRLEGNRHFQGYRHLYPLDVFGWWAAAEVFLEQGRVGRSIPLLERAEDLSPHNPQVHRVWGRVLLDALGDPQGALVHLRTAHREGLRNRTFLNLYARARYRAGMFAGAARLLERLRARTDTPGARLQYNLGSSYLGDGSLSQARDHFRRAFQLGYRDIRLYDQWALCLEALGKTRDAYSLLHRGLEWGDRHDRPVQRLRDHLDRMFEGVSPEPLPTYLSPLLRDIETPGREAPRTSSPD